MLAIYELASGFDGDMTHTMVELFRCEYFFGYCNDLPLMNNFVETF